MTQSLKLLQNQLKTLYKKRQEVNKEIDETYQELNKFVKFRFTCTDHALIKYLKDIELIPVAEARFKILSAVETFFDENPNINPETLKDTYYKIQLQGIIYVVNNYTVITVYPNE